MTAVAQSSVAQKIIRPNVFRPTGFSPNRLHPLLWYGHYDEEVLSNIEHKSSVSFR